MKSYIVRHWSGAAGAWHSLFNAIAAYAVSTLVVVWIVMQTGGGGLLVSIALLLVWIPVIIWGVVGMFRSAIRALANWRSRKVEAVGGGVVIAVLLVAAYIVGRDIWALLA